MLVEFLKANSDIFAWQPSDMTGVPRELAKHSLNVYPYAKPVKQSLRRFGDEKRKAIAKELVRLELADFITEVIDTDWVANPVLIPKKDTIDLRMCVDYTALNKGMPKRSVSFAKNRSSYRLNDRIGITLFSRRIFRISPNTDEKVGSN